MSGMAEDGKLPPAAATAALTSACRHTQKHGDHGKSQLNVIH